MGIHGYNIIYEMLWILLLVCFISFCWHHRLPSRLWRRRSMVRFFDLTVPNWNTCVIDHKPLWHRKVTSWNNVGTIVSFFVVDYGYQPSMIFCPGGTTLVSQVRTKRVQRMTGTNLDFKVKEKLVECDHFHIVDNWWNKKTLTKTDCIYLVISSCFPSDFCESVVPQL